MRQSSVHHSAPAVLRVLAASLVAAFGQAPGLALAQTPVNVLPTGHQVIAGSAAVSTEGGRMNVINSSNTVLDWQSFSIGAANGVHFQQPGADSKVLNRVVGNDPSSILGSLSSNGQVWLVNPHGVLFGAGARIDVGALVASSLNVSNDDFLASRNRFEAGGAAAGTVVNQGNLATSFGGRVWLVGGAVRNEGTVDAPGGQIVLAAGQSIDLVDSGLPNVTVRVSAPENTALNLGQLVAAGGSIDVHGAIVNQAGIVRADSLGANAAGRVVLRATNDLHLAAASVTTANAEGDALAGSVEASAGGSAILDGALSASAANQAGGALTFAGGTGGVRVSDSASLHANGGYLGNGGQIMVHSTGTTEVFGTLQARAGNAGSAGGNGGAITTIGAVLDARPASIDAQGSFDGGTWLLGADSLRIIDVDIREQAGQARAGAAESLINNTTIGTAMESGMRVTLAAQGTDSGNVTIDAIIDAVLSKPNAALTLEARNDVVVAPDAMINAEGGNLKVALVADADGDGAGAIRIGTNGRVYTDNGQLQLRAPRIEIDRGTLYAGGDIGLSGNGIALDGANLQAWGQVRINGTASIALNNSNIWSPVPGDAIVLSGASVSTTGSALQASGGRWLVYLDSLTDTYSDARFASLGSTFLQVGAGAGDSAIPGYEGRNGVVVRAGLDVRVHVDADRVYDGSARAAFSRALSSNLSDQFSLDNPDWTVEGTFADKHAGSAKAVTITGDPAFRLTTASGLEVIGARQYYVADVARAPVTVLQGSAQDKVYDANRTAILSGTVSGVLEGDVATLDGAHGLFDTKHAGAGKTVVINGAMLAGPDGHNYMVRGPDVQADIAARALGGDAMTALDKVYDGARDASLSQTLTGILAGDDVRLGGAGAAFDDRNAGNAKTVSVSGAFLAGADAGNYALDPSATLRASIAQRQLQASGVTAQDKIYDGTTTAVVSAALAGMIDGDDVRIDGLAGVFSDRHAGSGKTVFLSGASLTGSDAGNYSFSAPESAYASITQRQIAAGALTVHDKIYDGSRDASVAAALSGILAGDNVYLDGATGLFADKHAGSGKTVTLSGGALAGTDAANYTLGGDAGMGSITGHANITPRALGAANLAAQDKVYDGTREATLSGSISGVLAGDSVSLDGAIGTFADKHAGVGKIVTVSGAALAGADALNYTVDVATTVRAGITPRVVTATGVSARDKVYDGSRDAEISGALAGAVAGDAVAYEASGQFDSKNVGRGKQVAISASLRGADAANYILNAPASTSAAITHRELDIVIRGPVSKEYDATTAIGLAPEGFALRGAVAGDDLAVRGPAQGSFDTRDAGRDKLVSARGMFEILGADAANYRVGASTLAGTSNRVQATATGTGATITPATLVYAATPSSFVGGLAVSGLGGTVNGFKGDDTLANATTGSLQWHSTATPGAAPGAHPIIGSGLFAANYVLVQAPGNATALDIRPGIAAGGPQQRAQDAGHQAIASGMETVLPALQNAVVTGSLFDRSSPAAARVFGAVDVGAMSQNELAQVLAQRRDFKRKLFADAVYKLTIDPSLADVRACDSAADASSGVCRVTPGQLSLLHATQAQVSSALARHSHASLPQIERKIALLIGVDNYTDKDIPQLENAVRDADSVGKLFASKLGYDVRVARNPDKAEIIRMLNALAAEVGNADSVVIYYAGHGFSLETNGAGYWLPSDADATDPKGWMSNSDIAQFLGGIRSKQVTLISDSCYSGAFAREGLAAVGTNVTVDDVLAKRSVVVLSSGGDEPVPDNGRQGHSIFAWTLMQVIDKVQSWTPGSSVFADVQARVKTEFPQTPKYGSVTAAGHQVGGDYLFELRSQ